MLLTAMGMLSCCVIFNLSWHGIVFSSECHSLFLAVLVVRVPVVIGIFPVTTSVSLRLYYWIPSRFSCPEFRSSPLGFGGVHSFCIALLVIL